MKLPKYLSHKTVSAAPIEKVTIDGDKSIVLTLGLPDGSTQIVSKPFAWKTKHEPKPGDYYVVYADGYDSISPADAFEAGNSILDGDLPEAGAVMAVLIELAHKNAKANEIAFCAFAETKRDSVIAGLHKSPDCNMGSMAKLVVPTFRMVLDAARETVGALEEKEGNAA